MPLQTALGAAGALPTSLNDVLSFVNTNNKQPSTGRRVFGGLLGGVLNMFMPGVGSAIGGLISGGSLSPSGMLGDAQQYLQLQQQANKEQRDFEMATTIIKLRQDCAMSAIRNMKSS